MNSCVLVAEGTCRLLLSRTSHITDVSLPSVWHAVGTASLSAAGSKSGVVGPDLKVKGTVGLRVADASVLPLVPSGHTTGPVFVVGELAAEFIKSGY
jgi:choline dehydrogenase-like flavoprotein